MKKMLIPWLLVLVLGLSACVNTTHGGSPKPDGGGLVVHADDDLPSPSETPGASSPTSAPSTAPSPTAEPEEDEITVLVDGQKVEFPDGKPFMDENARILVPARFIGEALGAEVIWDEETQTASFERTWLLESGQYDVRVSFQVGQAEYTMQVKGPTGGGSETFTMDTKATNGQSRIFVPVRYLAEALSAEVEYDAETRTVSITSVVPDAGGEPGRQWESTPTTPPETTTPTPTPPPATPEPTPTPAAPGRTYNMDDPNVQKHPIYATAGSAVELQAGSPGWRSAAEIIAEQKRDHEDYLIDGMTFYEWRMAPIQAWVDSYVSANGLSYKGKTDFEKTAIIRHIVESGRLEELIGLWRPNFQFTTDDCVPLAEAVEFMMIAMDFGMFKSVPCTVNLPHATNGYWDSTVGAIRFIDANLSFDVWNIFVDGLYEKGFKLH